MSSEIILFVTTSFISILKFFLLLCIFNIFLALKYFARFYGFHVQEDSIECYNLLQVLNRVIFILWCLLVFCKYKVNEALSNKTFLQK